MVTERKDAPPRQRGVYVRLPSDKEFMQIWYDNDENPGVVAIAIGCSESAVYKRSGELGLRTPKIRQSSKDGPVWKANERMEGLEKALQTQLQTIETLGNQLRTLADRVKGLESQRIASQISHKRIVDGGEHAKVQRKRQEPRRIA